MRTPQHALKIDLQVVVEHGVVQVDLQVEPFWFIFDIFWENQWMSLFKPVKAYTLLVWEFYFNMDHIVLNASPQFKTKVAKTSITINPRLISDITGIPLTMPLYLLIQSLNHLEPISWRYRIQEHIQNGTPPRTRFPLAVFEHKNDCWLGLSCGIYSVSLATVMCHLTEPNWSMPSTCVSPSACVPTW